MTMLGTPSKQEQESRWIASDIAECKATIAGLLSDIDNVTHPATESLIWSKVHELQRKVSKLENS